MPLPKELKRFFEKLQRAEKRLLLLDYDGTLSPFVEDRDKAYPYDGVVPRLQKLVDSETTRTVVVTGRAIEHIKPLLKLERLPEIFGSHGWEHLTPDGEYHLKDAAAELQGGMEKALQYISENNLEKYLEKKPASLAIHFRGVKESEALDIKAKMLYNWKRIIKTVPLIFSEFDGGLELKYPGFNKGDVVNTILKDYPVNPTAAYLGDDLTDEDAFRALPENAVGILVRPEYRETSADFWIKPPDELLMFLDRWMQNDR